MKVGDLIKKKDLMYAVSVAKCGIILEVGDLRKEKPYKVFCPTWRKVFFFEKKYIQQDCEVISAALK